MSIHRSWLFLWCALTLTVSALIACASDHRGTDASSDTGTVTMPLQTTSASGNVYQLRNATFAVQDPAGAVVTTLSTAGFNPTDATLRAALQAGSYSILLEPGWQVVQVSGTQTTNVVAQLASANPVSFSITANQNTPVGFVFNVTGQGTVGFGGNLDISITVNEVDGGTGTTTFPLTVSLVQPPGAASGGSVTSPLGINCTGQATSDCSESFAAGSQVTLTATATPASGLAFGGWSGAGCADAGGTVPTTSQITLTMSGAVSCVATFVQTGAGQASLTVNVVLPPGATSGGSVTSLQGINCTNVATSDCSESLPLGTNVTLTATATPASGLAFGGWSGAGCADAGGTVPTTSQITLTMSGAVNCVATFVQAGAGWTPAQLSPRAWYSAESQFVTLAGTSVTAWADRSGNGNNLAQTPAVLAPSWGAAAWGVGQPAMIFSGANGLASSAASIAGAWNGDDVSFSVLAVMRVASDADGAVATWESTSATGSFLRARISNGGPLLRFQASGDDGLGAQNDENALLSVTSGNVVAWVRDTTISRLFTDGQPSDTGTVNVGPVTATTFRVGAALTGADVFLNGRLAELVIVPRAVLATEFAQFRTYAKAKWSGLP